VKLKADGKVDVSIPQDDGDLNDQYDAEMRIIATKAPKEIKVVTAQDKQEDYYKGFRSAVVLVWMFSNLALSAVVLSTAGTAAVTVANSTSTDRATIYMAVVLWSVAVLSLIRFIGAMWFLVVRMVSYSHPCREDRFAPAVLEGKNANFWCPITVPRSLSFVHMR